MATAPVLTAGRTQAKAPYRELETISQEYPNDHVNQTWPLHPPMSLVSLKVTEPEAHLPRA